MERRCFSQAGAYRTVEIEEAARPLAAFGRVLVKAKAREQKAFFRTVVN